MDQEHVVWRNALEMLYARGYSRTNIKSIFLHMYTAAIIDNGSDDEDTKTALPKLMMIMDTNEKVGIDTVRRVVHELKADIQVAILIIRKKMTPFAQQAIDQLHHGNDGRIEVFTFSDLYVNICKHNFVPQHRVLSLEEKAAVTKSFSATDASFPKLLNNDPLTRYYGLTQGDMVQFVRKTGYETRNIYRVVA